MQAPLVTAVVVTRTAVDAAQVVAEIAAAPSVQQIVVWDNSTRYADLSVYGRYTGIYEAEYSVVYVQDDDCSVDAQAVIDAYEPGRLVANMPRSRWSDYPDSTLVGWGAVFDKDLPEVAFDRFVPSGFDIGAVAAIEAFQRDCDLVFSALTPRTVIDVGFEHLPWAETPGRLFRQPGHTAARASILAECRRIRTWPDDDRRG